VVQPVKKTTIPMGFPTNGTSTAKPKTTQDAKTGANQAGKTGANQAGKTGTNQSGKTGTQTGNNPVPANAAVKPAVPVQSGSNAQSTAGQSKVTTVHATASKPATPSAARKDTVKKSKVYLLHSDVLRKNKFSTIPDAQVLTGSVEFRHDSVYMYCDSANFYDQENRFEAFDNVKMVQGDTLFLYGDYLDYDGNTQMARVRNLGKTQVRMENRKTTLLTDSLNYDRLYNVGYYFDGGTLMDEENVLTSDWGEYSPATKLSVFNYDVRLVNPKFTLTSDTLRYHTDTKVANIVGPSDIVSDENHIYSERGYYNTATNQAELLDRSQLRNGNKNLTGDSLFYDRTKGYGEAFGHILFTDTVQKACMTGDYGFYNELTGYAYATKKAVGIDYSQGDSLYLHGDTLQMYTYYMDTDSMYREMRAYHKVRFYRTDLQGVCDSLVFSSRDSVLTMYTDPILWNNSQQLVGEEILVYMNDSTVDWAHINGQALSVEEIDTLHYNQVSGKEMKAYFLDGELNKVDVIGSVRVVYYPMEKDSTLMFMNVSETSLLNVFLRNRKMYKMVMSPKSNGTLYPMEDLPKDKMRLDQFVWFDYIRPLHKDDIFEWRGKHADQMMRKSNRGTAPLPNKGLFKDVKPQEQKKAEEVKKAEEAVSEEVKTEEEKKEETK
jgi:lipopolysaccharide export system protein LptA